MSTGVAISVAISYWGWLMLTTAVAGLGAIFAAVSITLQGRSTRRVAALALSLGACLLGFGLLVALGVWASRGTGLAE